jgi:DNA-binding response OmpR family regulator
MKRILVVDDDKDILQVVQIVLQLQGYDTMLSWKGEETLKNVNSFSPDVILLDVNLGSTNGMTICTQLKSDSKTHDIPVIMFSAHSNSKIKSECAADGFIGKPFDIFKLADIIKSQLPSTLN